MSTYRERREAKADRLREWADKREVKADADLSRASQMAGAIPLGQPMMPDHYSYNKDRRYRDRMHSTMGRGIEHSRKAESFRSQADNIEAAAEHAVYSDDTDAIERLEARVAEREAERSRLKAFNASARKGSPDLELLDDKQRANYESVVKHCPYQLGKGGAFPGYALSNLGASIRKDVKRLEGLRS